MYESDKYTAHYTTFSGADIVPTINDKVIGTMQAITYSVTREKVPVYSMGSPDPRSFSRGKRGIAGSMVFTTFDRDALLFLREDDSYGVNQYVTAYSNAVRVEPDGSETYGTAEDVVIMSAEDWEIAMSNLSRANQALFVQNTAYYADQIKPFDVTITLQNEYGNAARFSVLGCEILNEGSGMSIDDITTEKAVTFVARGLTPLVNIVEGTYGTIARPDNSSL